MKSDLLPITDIQSLPRRGITEETCRKFGYGLGEYYCEFWMLLTTAASTEDTALWGYTHLLRNGSVSAI